MNVEDLPRIGFVLGGVQKGGTTALARYLGLNSGISLPREKEAHVFDAEDFDESATVEAINLRYAAHFDGWSEPRLFGDATPIYALHPRFIARIHRYNPAMRWVLLLRHPVARALSNFHMERSWGRERAPFWWALLREPARLKGHHDDFSTESPLRHAAYRLRGDYARQLDQLYALFPREQVLVLRSSDLARDTAATVNRVCDFLGVSPLPGSTSLPPIFVGRYPAWTPGGWRWRLACWWMRRELDDMASRHDLTWEESA